MASSGSTEFLYQRLHVYPKEIVSDDLGIAITRPMEGTPTAMHFRQLVVLMTQGLTMFRSQYGLIGTANPGVAAGEYIRRLRVCGCRLLCDR